MIIKQAIESVWGTEEQIEGSEAVVSAWKTKKMKWLLNKLYNVWIWFKWSREAVALKNENSKQSLKKPWKSYKMQKKENKQSFNETK